MRSFTDFGPLASSSFGPLGSAPGFTYLGLLKSARFHQLWPCRVSPTLGPSQAAGFTSFEPLGSARSRFQLLWASSRVPGFTNFRPPASARFHLLWAPRKLQVSPTLGPSQAAGFTSFGPLGSAPGFSYFGPPQECQVSPISGPRECQVSPTLSSSQAPSFTYCRPLASCRLHLFWAPWKRSRFQLLWASSRVPGFTNFRPRASAIFHLLWAPRKLQVPTLGRSQAAGFTSFGRLGSAPGFTYFGPPQECQVSPTSPLTSARFHLLLDTRPSRQSYTLLVCHPAAPGLHLISVPPSPPAQPAPGPAGTRLHTSCRLHLF